MEWGSMHLAKEYFFEKHGVHYCITTHRLAGVQASGWNIN